MTDREALGLLATLSKNYRPSGHPDGLERQRLALLCDAIDEALAGVHLGDEGLRRPAATGYGTDGDMTVKAIQWPDGTFTVERLTEGDSR